MSDSVTYAFATEWFDARAQQVRSFTLIYYDGGVSNGMLELVDTRPFGRSRH